MSNVVCPVSGQECFMAQWTADHIEGQFYIPGARRQDLCAYVVSRVMVCDGTTENCEPAEPASIELAVEEFKQQIKESS